MKTEFIWVIQLLLSERRKERHTCAFLLSGRQSNASQGWAAVAAKSQREFSLIRQNHALPVMLCGDELVLKYLYASIKSIEEAISCASLRWYPHIQQLRRKLSELLRVRVQIKCHGKSDLLMLWGPGVALPYTQSFLFSVVYIGKYNSDTNRNRLSKWSIF